MTEQIVGAPVEDLLREQENEIARLGKLVEASGRLLATLDLEDVLPQVLELAGANIDADAYALWRRLPTGEWQLQAFSGLSDEYAASTSRTLRRSRSAVSLDAPIVAADIAATPWLTDEHREAHRREGNAAFVAIPLRYGGEVTGTLTFYYRRPHNPSEAELRSATAVANLAAAALGTAAAHADNQQQLRFVAEAGEALASSLDYDATLAVVARLAVGRLADWCIVDVVEGTVIRRVAVAAADDDQQQALEELQDRFPPNWDSPQPAARALRAGGAVVFESFDQNLLATTVYDEDHLRLMTKLDPRSAVALPLVARGETLGAITFAWSRSGRTYVESDLPVLEDLARRASLAVDNARLYQAERAAGARLAFLAEASSTLASSLDYETTLRNVASLVVPEFADWCAIDVVDDNGDIRRLAVVHKRPELVAWAVRSRDLFAPKADEPEGTGRVVRTGEALLYHRVTDELLQRTTQGPEHLEVLRKLGMASAMVVPLKARGRTLGALMLVSSDVDRLYVDDDLDFAEYLGRRAAIAVDNAIHYRRSGEALALLDAIFEAAPVGLEFFDTELRWVRVNDALADMHGIAIEEHIGRSPTELLPTFDERAGESRESVLRTGEPAFLEAIGETPAQPGVRRVFEMHHYPVHAEDGGIAGVGAVVQDVTDRRRAASAVRLLAEAGHALASSLEPKSMLQSLADLAVPDVADTCVVHIVNEDGVLERVAAAFADDQLRVLSDELQRKWPLRLNASRGPAAAVATGRVQIAEQIQDEDLVAAARSEEHLDVLRRFDVASYVAIPMTARERTLGAITFALRTGRRYRPDDIALLQALTGRVALATDNALLFHEVEQQAQSALALAFVGDGVFLVDEDGVVRIWNTAAVSITGLPAGNVVGRAASEAIPGWGAIDQSVLVTRLPETPRAVSVPIELYGAERWLSVSGVAFDGGTVYAFRDLTGEQRVERLKSEFVSTISHELRTPLAAIYGAALTLRREEPALEAQREGLLDVISGEAERLARIVNDILWASRLESGTLHIAVESCDAGVLAESVADAARAHVPPNIHLALEVEDGLASVAADPDKLRQVLTNLVDNAIKYSPDGGDVRMKVDRRGGFVRFVVRDEGLGIPRVEQERIFDKFYRLDPELTRGIGGTGLGLYITRELVRRMNGRVVVRSEERVGSTFTVELPTA